MNDGRCAGETSSTKLTSFFELSVEIYSRRILYGDHKRISKREVKMRSDFPRRTVKFDYYSISHLHGNPSFHSKTVDLHVVLFCY